MHAHRNLRNNAGCIVIIIAELDRHCTIGHCTIIIVLHIL